MSPLDREKNGRVAPKRVGDSITVVTDTKNLLLSTDSPITRIYKQVGLLRTYLQVLVSPGESQFKDLPKRVRLMFISVVIPFLFVAARLWLLPLNQSIYLWSAVALVLAALTYGGMYWGVKGQVRSGSFWTVLPLPSLFVLANVLFLSYVFVGELNRVYLWGLFGVAIGIFMILLYVLALAVNILNVSLFYTIPLGRLGESIAYLFAVITVFLGTYVVSSVAIPMFIGRRLLELVLLGGFVLFWTAVLSFSLWAYFIASSRNVLLSVVSLAAFLTISLAVFTFTVPYSWFAASLQAVFAYVLYGFLIHKEQNTYKSSVAIEYFMAIALMFLVVVLV